MVRGILKFENPDAVPTGQRIRISVQDTSRVGADSIDVAETVVTIPEDFDAGTTDLPFEIELTQTTRGLTMRAHMPRHDGADVRQGDMVTTNAIEVNDDEEVSVVLNRVV